MADEKQSPKPNQTPEYNPSELIKEVERTVKENQQNPFGTPNRDSTKK